jgi:dTDP-4-dehydrorhamnose 3,5-epimerase-like enzyme
MNKPKIIKLSKIGDPSLGYISVLEESADLLPFRVKRVYWTYFTPNHVERGNHAHKTLEQIIVAVSGIIDFELTDREGHKYKFVLDSPDRGLHIPGDYWREIRFSHNAVLLCLASEVFDVDDYIRDFDEFMETLKP